MKPGMIGFSNNKVGTLAKLIRYFTKSNLSHTFLITTDVAGEASLQEANSLISIMPFDKTYKQDEHTDYYLYDVVATEERRLDALNKVYVEFAGTTYGFFQNVWFIYRWFAEKLGYDVRKQKNWMTNGVICSELVYYYLSYLGPEYKEILKDWNPDTIMPADIAKLAVNHKELFIFVEKKSDVEMCLG